MCVILACCSTTAHAHSYSLKTHTHTYTHTHIHTYTHIHIHTCIHSSALDKSNTHLGSVRSGTPLHRMSTPEVCELNTGLSSERFAMDLTSR